MRALLAHPLLRLTVALLAATFLAPQAFAQVPLSIGPLSDYGSVLDRHGRERIDSLIQDTKDRLGIAVSILATWENAYATPRGLANAVFQVWNLASGRTLLAVFVRTDGQWRLSIVASSLVRQSLRGLETDLESALIDLVEHDRIEEAMVELFSQIDRFAAGTTRPVRTSPDEQSGGVPKPVLVLLVLGAVAILMVFAHRRICPRCGRLLRIDRRSIRSGGSSSDRIYYCRHCHYRRGRP